MPSGFAAIAPKKYNVILNETATAAVPITPDNVFPKLFPKKTLIKNPKKGANNKSKAKFVFIIVYPFKFFKLSIVMDPKFLNIETRIANPTATSAAATAIEKKTKTCPSAS